MGREITGIHVIDKRPNSFTGASNGTFNDKVHFSPKIAAVKAEPKDREVEASDGANSLAEKSPVKKEVLGAKSPNHNGDMPELKNEKPEAQKMGDIKKFSLPATSSTSTAVAKWHAKFSVPQSSNLATEKHDSSTQTVDTQAIETGGNLSLNADDNTHSSSSTKNSEVFETKVLTAVSGLVNMLSC